MTLGIIPDFVLSNDEKNSIRSIIYAELERQALNILNVSSVDIREAIVGGTAVTQAQTNLPPDIEGGASAPAVDFVIDGATATTTVGWHFAAGTPTADTFVNIVGTNQAVCTSHKVIVFYGVVDFTTGGDLAALQFKSNTNVKGYINTEKIYESQVGEYVGGYFADLESGVAAGIYYGVVDKQPWTIQALWHTAGVAKNTALRCFVAEVSGTVVTTKPLTAESGLAY